MFLMFKYFLLMTKDNNKNNIAFHIVLCVWIALHANVELSLWCKFGKKTICYLKQWGNFLETIIICANPFGTSNDAETTQNSLYFYISLCLLI